MKKKNRFWICTLISIGILLVINYSCKKEEEKMTAILTTTIATNITSTTATSGGNVTSNGIPPISERGVCYSTSQNPTIASSKVVANGTIGAFTCNLVGLSSGSLYYIRAYAINSVGTSYGSEKNFTTYNVGAISDVDNNYYNIVTIGTQTWMKENLRTTKYNNGNDIPNITDNASWSAQTAGAYCWYYNNDGFKSTYGALYNCYTVEDERNLCPTGWHVPTHDEWLTLADFLTNNGYGFEGSGNDIGKALAATSDWTFPHE